MGAGGRASPWRTVGARAFLAFQVVLLTVLVAVAVALVFLGAGIVAYGVGQFSDSSSLRSTADGTVLSHWQDHDSRGGRTDRIQVRFTAADGTSHAFSEAGRGKAGDRIRVHYKAEDPGDASTRSAGDNKVLAGLAAFIGLAMTLCMLGVLARGGWELVQAVRERWPRPEPRPALPAD